MSIRIGNTVYIEGLPPITVAASIAQDFERIADDFEVNENTLADLIANEPGGIIRVGRRK